MNLQDAIINIIQNPVHRKIIAIYIILINIVGFSAMGIDKRKAIKNEWRIPEKRLFLYSLLGGSLGTWTGMYFWGHKTRKFPFIIGMPLILFIHITIGIYLFTIYNR